MSYRYLVVFIYNVFFTKTALKQRFSSIHPSMHSFRPYLVQSINENRPALRPQQHPPDSPRGTSGFQTREGGILEKPDPLQVVLIPVSQVESNSSGSPSSLSEAASSHTQPSTCIISVYSRDI